MAIFKGCNYIFHFKEKVYIVPSIENPVKYLDANITTARVLEAEVRKASVKKFVYSASSSCYGIAKSPTSENEAINPLYPYAMSNIWAKIMSSLA